MIKAVGLALAVGLACCGVAHGADGKRQLDRWDAVERLTPGVEINVLAGNAAGPDLCLLSVVDDNSLTCLDEFSASDVRLVFPRSAVRDVWVIERAHGWDAVTWIKAVLIGAGVTLAVACIAVNVGCLLPVGALVLAVVPGRPLSAGTWPGPPPRPPRPPRYRRRLVYRAPAAATVSP